MRLEGFSTTWPNLFSNTFATVGEFYRVLPSFTQLSCTALSQSESSKFFMYIISSKNRKIVPYHGANPILEMARAYGLRP